MARTRTADGGTQYADQIDVLVHVNTAQVRSGFLALAAEVARWEPRPMPADFGSAAR